VESRTNKILVAVIAALAILLLSGVAAVALAGAWFIPLRVESNKANAQETFIPAAQADMSTTPVPITVRGIGKISVKPDTIIMNVGASAQEATVKEAQTKVTQVIDAMAARLKANGVSDADYRTAQYNVEPIMDYGGKEGTNAQPRLIGFRVTNILEITLRDTARASELLDALTTAGANTVYGISYTFADAEGLSRQAYNGALQDAQARAAKLAELSDLKLGKIVTISEASAASANPFYGKEGLGGGGAGIYPGQQQVQVDLLVTFEATPAK